MNANIIAAQHKIIPFDDFVPFSGQQGTIRFAYQEHVGKLKDRYNRPDNRSTFAYIKGPYGLLYNYSTCRCDIGERFVKATGRKIATERLQQEGYLLTVQDVVDILGLERYLSDFTQQHELTINSFKHNALAMAIWRHARNVIDVDYFYDYSDTF